jgi:MFS transporter, DHA2 family, methylenomycin A resistance protein
MTRSPAPARRTSYRSGGALAVATFGALVAGSFLTGTRVSMLISATLLLLSTAAAFAVFRRRAS